MLLTHKEILRILNDCEFVLQRQVGSHQRFEKNGYGVTIPTNKEYPKKTAKSMLETIATIIGIDYKELVKTYKIKI